MVGDSAQHFAQISLRIQAVQFGAADQADVELDAAKRADLYSQAQKLVISDVAGVMLWNNVNSYLVKPTVKGIVQTPQDSGWPGDVDPLTELRQRVSDGPDTVIPAAFCRRADLSTEDALKKP